MSKIIETKRYEDVARDLAYDIEVQAEDGIISYWLTDDYDGIKLKMFSYGADKIDDKAVLATIDKNIDKYLNDFDDLMYEVREKMNALDTKYMNE